MAVIGTLVSGLAIGLIIFSVSCCLRKAFPRFYAYKCFENTEWAPEFDNSFFHWIWTTLQIRNEYILRHPGGYDAYQFLLLMKYSIMYITFVSVIGMAFILPTNWSGTLKDLPDGDPRKPSGVDLFTMANIDGDQFGAYYMLYKLYSTFAITNHARLKSESLTARTVMIRNVPPGIKTDEDLQILFIEEYGGRMTDTFVTRNTTNLQKFAEKRKSYFQLWKDAKYLEALKNIRPVYQPKVLKIFPKGQPVDAIAYYEKKLDKYNDLLIRGIFKLHSEKKYLHTMLTPKFKKNKTRMMVTENYDESESDSDSEFATPETEFRNTPKKERVSFSPMPTFNAHQHSGTTINKQTQLQQQTNMNAQKTTNTNEIEQTSPPLSENTNTKEEEEKETKEISKSQTVASENEAKLGDTQAKEEKQTKKQKNSPSKTEKQHDQLNANKPKSPPKTPPTPKGLKKEESIEKPNPAQPDVHIHQTDQKISTTDVVFQKDKTRAKLDKKFFPKQTLTNEEQRKLMTESTPLKQKKLRQRKSFWHRLSGHLSSQERFDQGLELKNTGEAFISLDSLAIAMQAVQTLQLSDPDRLHLRMAPDPADVAWEWLGLTNTNRIVRTIFTSIAVVILVVFWAIPTTAISAWTSLATLSLTPALDSLSWVAGLGSIVQSIVTGLLPSLVLLIWVALVPVWMRLILKQRGFRLRSDLDISVMIAFYAFHLVNTVLVVTIAGSFWDSLAEALNDWSLIAQLLSNSLPSQSLFYTQFAITSTSIAWPMYFFTPWFLFLMIVGIKKAKTPYSRRLAEAPGSFSYHTTCAWFCLLWTVGIIYSVMSPFVSAWTLYYMGIAYFVCKYVLFYFAVPDYTGLELLPYLINFLTVGLCLFQLTMAGLFGLKSFTLGTVVAAVMFIITIVVRVRLGLRWYRSAYYLPLQLCPNTSNATRKQRHNKDDIHTVYCDPAALYPLSIEEEREKLRPELEAARRDYKSSELRKEHLLRDNPQVHPSNSGQLVRP